MPSSNAYMSTLLLLDADNLEILVRHRDVLKNAKIGYLAKRYRWFTRG